MRPVVCPAVVGREEELKAITRVLDAVSSGQGATLLLSGEAGIGKSRLVTETQAQAVRRGFAVLRGRCFEPDRALPYAPLLDLLEAVQRPPTAVDPSRQATVASGAAELAALLQEGPAQQEAAPEREQRRVARTLAGFLLEHAAVQPLLVVIEDAHWSDDASLEVLLHLARQVPSHGLLLVVTYRGDDVSPRLGHFLAALDRERLGLELPLAPLSEPQVEAMLRAIFGLQRPLRADLLHDIFTLTEGNPFFVEEVVQALIPRGDIPHADVLRDLRPSAEVRIPRSIQDAVQRRLERLSNEALHVLRIAAVAGRRFDFALLQELAGHREAELLELMKEAIAAHLVVEEAEDQFAFRHALTRQAIYTDLLARERRRLHGRVAEALERLHPADGEGSLADVAYHCYEAGLWERAKVYARRAGERARALHAPHAAIEQLTRALQAARHLGAPPPAAALRARGAAYETIGEFERALADYATALETARAARDLGGEWQALLDLGMLWAGRDYARTGEYWQRALELARAIGDPATLARSLNRVGNWYVNVEQSLEGGRLHEEALAIFRGLDDPRGVADTLDLLGMASHLAGDLVQSTRYFEEAVEHFRHLDDRLGFAFGLAMLVTRGGGGLGLDSLVPAAPTLAECVPEGELAVKIAGEIGWRAGESYAQISLAECLAAQGRYGRALELARGGLEAAEEIEHRPWTVLGHATLGTIYLDLLELTEARHHLDQALAAARAFGSPFFVRAMTAFFASVCVAQRDLALAEGLLEEVLTPGASTRMPALRVALCARAELALARGDAQRARAIADDLIASAPNRSPDRVLPRLWKLRGEALAALGDREEAEANLQAAAAAAEAQGARPLLWRIQAVLGKLYAASGRRDDAEQVFSAARTVVEALAADLSDDRLQEAFRRRAGAYVPVARPSTPLRAAKQQFGGLTARERQVAVLIAQGRTNRQLAEALSITEQTAETHVERILRKLGSASRAQVAAWATQQGLLTEAPSA